ncbi:MAG: hypothetical protein KDB35_22060 [Acidimicrobiales bacterium]|nr:hypothetical protein [Acidimicrobiales bacterium]MCB1017599.1 hypothetical protein [Acidimicrobiales bacterium]MCB9374002.1 hypothetical protein [Microthrixaceae bacterium]
MRIATAIPVRHTEQLRDGTFLLVGAGASRVRVKGAFPSAVAVRAFVEVACEPNEATAGAHHLTAEVLGPQLTAVTADPLRVEFDVQPGPGSVPGWEAKIPFTIAVRFEAAEPGAYSLELTADDASHSLPFLVEAVQQNQA